MPRHWSAGQERFLPGVYFAGTGPWEKSYFGVTLSKLESMPGPGNQSRLHMHRPGLNANSEREFCGKWKEVILTFHRIDELWQSLTIKHVGLASYPNPK
jgi:hypothetical protein